MSIFQVNGIDPGVQLGRLDMPMAKKFLDITDIRPLLKKMSGTAPAEAVRGCGFLDPGSFLVMEQCRPDAVTVYRLALIGEEESSFLPVLFGIPGPDLRRYSSRYLAAFLPMGTTRWRLPLPFLI